MPLRQNIILPKPHVDQILATIPATFFSTTTTGTPPSTPAQRVAFAFALFGWTGVSEAEPGGSATGPAPGTYEAGIEDYKVLVGECPSTGTVAGTALRPVAMR